MGGQGLYGLGALVSASLVAGLGFLSVAQAQLRHDPQGSFDGIGIEQKVGAMVDFDLRFRDHMGQEVRLGDLVAPSGGEAVPTMLTLNYYECPLLCTLQLNGLVDGLRGLSWTGKGKEKFRIVTVSIDPEEDPAMARAKRLSYLRMLLSGSAEASAQGPSDEELERNPPVEWYFLSALAPDPNNPDHPRTGTPEAKAWAEKNVRALADSVGFGYKYIADTNEWAHSPGVIFLTPQGKVARYLGGLQYLPQDLKFALIESGEGRIGTTLELIVMSCFQYNDTSGRYSPYAFGILRLAGVLTVFTILVMVIVLRLGEKRRSPADPSAPPAQVLSS